MSAAKVDIAPMKPALNCPVTREGYKIPGFPQGDRCVVERIDIEEELIHGIIIPGSEREKNQYATILAAGPLAMDVLRDMCIQIGETVLMGKYSGVDLSFRPPGTLKTIKLDVINVKDIFLGVELVDKVMDGRIGIDLHKEADGVERHRFFEEQTKEGAA